MTDELKPSTEVVVNRTADFISRYANNVRFESYGSDLKILFGNSDQASGKEVIEQHAAITLAWTQVKTFIYFLTAQLTIYEAQMGTPVPLHPISTPQPWPNEVPDDLKNDPHAKETLALLRELRQQLISKSKP